MDCVGVSRLPTIIKEEKKRVMGAIMLGPDARYNGKLRPHLKVMSWLRHYEVDDGPSNAKKMSNF